MQSLSLMHHSRQRARIAKPSAEVSPVTGPLGELAGRRVLVIADVQNLDCGARDLGYHLAWGRLGKLLDDAGLTVSRHAVFSATDPGDERCGYFAWRGWQPHRKQKRFVPLRGKWRRISNADGLLLFIAGALVAREDVSLVVLGSGDGDLVEEAAEGCMLLRPGIEIATLSLAGSTSYRLDAEASQFVRLNIEVGLDCLKPNWTPDGNVTSAVADCHLH